MRLGIERARKAEAVRVLGITANDILRVVREKIVELDGRSDKAAKSIDAAIQEVGNAIARIVNKYDSE